MKLCLVTILMALSGFSLARSCNQIDFKKYNYSRYAYNVFGIQASKFKGTAVPVLINNWPYLVTNSHILDYQSSDSSISFEMTSHDGNYHHFDLFELNYNLASADLAFFKLSESVSDEIAAVFCPLAKENVEFLPNDFKTFKRKDKSSFIMHYENKTREIKKLMHGYNPAYLPDLYISGLFKRIILIPSFTYPGVSGGGFFYKGEFRGIVSKVGLGVYPETYVIPVEEIANIVSQKYYQKSQFLKEYKFTSTVDEISLNFFDINDSRQELNLFESAADDIDLYFSKIINIGGELGDGGGELGDGGGELKEEKRLWNLILEPGVTYKKRPEEFDKPIKTQNPFWPTPSQITSKSKIYKINKENEFNFISETYAMMNYLKLNPQLSLAVIKIEELLEARRKNANQFYPKYSRIYRESDEKKNHFVLLSGNRHTYLGGFAQALFAEGRTVYLEQFPKKLDKHQRSGKESYYFSQMIWDGTYKLTKDDYVDGKPIMAKKVTVESDFFLDFKTHPDLKKGGKILSEELLERDSIAGKIDKDFKKIELLDNGKKIELRINTQQSNVFKNVYGQTRNLPRAVMFFRTDDISKVDRLFIQTNKYIFEFLTCIPGETCFR